jgi:hypothetical protein
VVQDLLNFEYFFPVGNSIRDKYNKKIKKIEFHTNTCTLLNYLTICARLHMPHFSLLYSLLVGPLLG